MNNLKSLFFIVFLFYSAIKVFSQQVITDSLILVLNSTSNESDKVKLLNEIGNQLRYTDIEEADQYLLKSEKLAIKLKNWEQLAESYNVQGIVWYNRSDIDSAFHYLNKGLSISKKYDNYNGMVKSLNSLGLYTYFKKDYNNALIFYNKGLAVIEYVTNLELIVMLYNNIAMLYKVRGDYDLSIEFYHKALIICEESGNDIGAGIVSSNLGLLYEKQEKYQLALEYLSKSLEIRRSQNNLKGEAIVLNNLGVVYEGLKQYEKALDCYYQSLKINKSHNQLHSVGRIYNNIGIIYKDMGMLDSAYINYNKSLELRHKLNDSSGLSNIYTNIGILKNLENNHNSAIKYFIDAANISEKENDLQGLVRIYKELYSSYNSIEDYKNAFEYSYKYQIVYDSIYNLNSRKYLEEVEGKYQNLKKEKENQALLSEILLKDEQLKKQVINSFLIVILAILILLVLFVVTKSKRKLQQVNKLLSQKNIQIENKRNKLKSAYEELMKLGLFKEKMTGMLVHDLKNPLNIILNAHEVYNEKDAKENISKSALQMLNLVTTMIDVYKKDHAQLELIKEEVLISDIVSKAKQEVDFLLTNKPVEFDFMCDKNFLVKVDSEIIKRVFVNLFTNAIKFSPHNGLITIKCEKNPENKLQVSLLNEGAGISKKKQESIFELYKQDVKLSSGILPSSGLGLAFCKLAIEAHEGNIGVNSETETGVEFWFTLPDCSIEEEKITSNLLIENNYLKFTIEELDILKPIINELKRLEVYQISEINKILRKIDHSSKRVKEWIEVLEQIVYEGNSKLYKSFLNQLG